jgi:hypothetical protein
MSEQRSPQHGATRRASATPLQRAYLATLTRRLFARRLFSPTGPAAFSHAVAIRLARMQQRPTRRR